MNDFTTVGLDDIESLNIMQGDSVRPRHLVRTVWGAARTALNEAGLEDTPVFVAGGSVRDVIYGFTPRDIDVFFEGPKDPDEMGDLLVYVTALMSDTLGDDVASPYGVQPSGVTGYLNKDKDFEVFRLPYAGTYPNSGHQWGSRFQTQIDVMGNYYPSKSVVDLVNRFDHDLVRCAYDGTNVLIDPRFLAAIKKKRVESADYDTQNRLLNWRDRTNVRGLVIGRPPKKPAPKNDQLGVYEIPVTTASTLQMRHATMAYATEQALEALAIQDAHILQQAWAQWNQPADAARDNF